MAEAIPLKLVSTGNSTGQLKEFAEDDRLPVGSLPVLTGLPATTGDVTETDSVLSGIGKLQASKVAKESGKGLSTNDYTTTEKNKLSGIADGAQVNSVTSVAGRTGAVTLAKGDVGLDNVDNTADSAKPVSVAQQAALDAKVSVAGDQFVTGAKTFTNPVVVQNGAGTGTLKIGADVNNNTLTDNTRKLARVVVPPRVAALPNWTLLAGDTTDNAGVNEVYFGGAPGSSIGGATSLSFFTAPDQSAGSGVSRWRIGSDGHLIPSAVSAYDLGSATTPIRSVVAGGPVRVGQYTLATLPSASAFNGYEIDVTNSTVAPAGPKRCRSNGTNWLILNTNTPVS